MCPYALSANGKTPSDVKPIQGKIFVAATLKAFDHSGKAVIHSVRADGSRVADHRGTLGHVMVARMGADGTFETYCTTEESAAEAWLSRQETGPSTTVK